MAAYYFKLSADQGKLSGNGMMGFVSRMVLALIVMCNWQYIIVNFLQITEIVSHKLYTRVASIRVKELQLI
jgi:hypothetical protein